MVDEALEKSILVVWDVLSNFKDPADIDLHCLTVMVDEALEKSLIVD